MQVVQHTDPQGILLATSGGGNMYHTQFARAFQIPETFG